VKKIIKNSKKSGFTPNLGKSFGQGFAGRRPGKA